jgi:hypothetical protein
MSFENRWEDLVAIILLYRDYRISVSGASLD